MRLWKKQMFSGHACGKMIKRREGVAYLHTGGGSGSGSGFGRYVVHSRLVLVLGLGGN